MKSQAKKLLEHLGKINEGRKSEGDAEAAEELAMWAENDGDLYKRQITPSIENLAKKMVKGVYDKEKAIQLWKYTADSAAKSYQKEFGDTFTAETRRMAAAMLADYYQEDVEEKAEELKKAKEAKGKK